MLNEHNVIKVYFTTKEIRQLTGWTFYKLYLFIKDNNVPYNKHKYLIKVHRKELEKYFSIKL